MSYMTRRAFMRSSGAAAACLALPGIGTAAAERAAPQVALRDGRQAPALGMGSWHLGQGGHPAGEELKALRTGIALGMTLIDTAEIYSGGASEELVGRAIRGQRDRVFLVSKVAPSHATTRGIPEACEASLQRLGTDHLDLYLLHWRSGTDLDAVVTAFEGLKKAGKIKAWGVSNFEVDDMQDLWQVEQGDRCAANQVRYSLEDRDIESGLLAWCREHQVAIMAYSPLGTGGLIGNATLEQIGKRHGVTGPAVAIAWTMRSGHVISIPESGSPEHIREDAKALALKLTADDMTTLDRVFPPPDS